MKKIAVTGTIAAGKSTVSILLRRRRKPVFDCDQYSRILYQRTNPCFDVIVDAFGEEILDDFGEIDRKKLAQIVFSDEEKRKQLNEIVHPRIIEGMKAFFMHHSDEPLVFAEVPLLEESGLTSYFDEIVLVTCSEDTAVKRMMEDRGYTEKEALARLASQKQYSKAQRKSATAVLVNDGTIRELDSAVGKLLREL